MNETDELTTPAWAWFPAHGEEIKRNFLDTKKWKKEKKCKTRLRNIRFNIRGSAEKHARDIDNNVL